MKSNVVLWRIVAGFCLVMSGMSATGLSAQDPPKKYDLKLEWKAVVGHRSQILQNDDFRFDVTAKSNGQVVNQSQNADWKDFAAIEVITQVRDGKPSELRWSFFKAVRLVDGNQQPYGFQGKTVVVKLDAENRHSFTYENGEALAPEDAAGLAKFHAGTDPKPGSPSGSEIYAPPHPVAVGETWKPDVALMAKSFGQEGSNLDLTQSTATGKLLFVEPRSSYLFGAVEMNLELYFTKFGNIQLDNPYRMVLLGYIEGCIDGTIPDNGQDLRIQIDQDVEGTLPDASRRVDLRLVMMGRGQAAVQSLM